MMRGCRVPLSPQAGPLADAMRRQRLVATAGYCSKYACHRVRCRHGLQIAFEVAEQSLKIMRRGVQLLCDLPGRGNAMAILFGQ